MNIVIENSGNDVTLVVEDVNNRSTAVFTGRLNRGTSSAIQVTADGDNKASIRVEIDGGPTTLYDRIRENDTVRVN